MQRSTVLFILLLSGYMTYAQTYYLVKNLNSGRKVKLDGDAAYIEYEMPSGDTAIKHIVGYVGASIDSISQTTIYLRKFHQVIRTEFANGTKLESNDTYYRSGDHVGANDYSYDSIRIADIIMISNYGTTNKSRVMKAVLITTMTALAGVVVVGPFFLGNAYFSTVGIAFLSAIPIIVTTGLVNSEFKFRSKSGKDRGLWHIEVAND